MAEYLLSELLECWELSIDLLIRLIVKYNLVIDFDNIKSEYWEITFWTIVLSVFTQIKDKFLKENEEEIKSLGYNNLDDVEYKIYIEYDASSIDMDDENIQKVFDKWSWKY